jgi:hypothetical protein
MWFLHLIPLTPAVQLWTYFSRTQKSPMQDFVYSITREWLALNLFTIAGDFRQDPGRKQMQVLGPQELLINSVEKLWYVVTTLKPKGWHPVRARALKKGAIISKRCRCIRTAMSKVFQFNHTQLEAKLSGDTVLSISSQPKAGQSRASLSDLSLSLRGKWLWSLCEYPSSVNTPSSPVSSHTVLAQSLSPVPYS